MGLLSLGGVCMLGLGTTNPAVDLDHMFVGALLAYAGFGRWDEACVRNIVGGLGVVYLMAGLLAFVLPALLLGMFSDTSNGILLNHMVHLTFGVSNVAAVVFLPQGTRAEY